MPLNRKFPVERTRAMLELADVNALIVDNDSLPQLREVLKGLRRPPALLLPATDAASLDRAFEGNVFDRRALTSTAPASILPAVATSDLAYLLFTSGSTGVPSGVPITHGNVRAFLDVNRSRYGLTSQDRLTQTFDQTFDLSHRRDRLRREQSRPSRSRDPPEPAELHGAAGDLCSSPAAPRTSNLIHCTPFRGINLAHKMLHFSCEIDVSNAMLLPIIFTPPKKAESQDILS